MQAFIGAVLLVSVHVAAQQDFTVDVNNDGTYSVTVKGNRWLKSAPTFFRADGQVFSSSDGSLKLVRITQSGGQDLIGQWESKSFLYQAGSSQIEATFVKYTPYPSIFTYNNPTIPFMFFKQKYMNGANNTAAADIDFTISGFPGFVLDEGVLPLGYFIFAGLMFGRNGQSAGQWGSKALRMSSGQAGGPLAIFDKETANTLVISSASEFMSASMWRQNETTGGNNIYWGTMGGVGMVPSTFESSYILFYGNQGINKAFVSWGQILQTLHKRTDHYMKTDLTVNYLGYWTDNGAYYYRVKEPGKNYQDTVVDVVSDINSLGLPFRYFQYDAWWYFIDNEHGIINWEGRPDVFPNGMPWVFNKTNLPVHAHSMFWSNKNVYARQNGGQYNFIMDGEKSLPTEERFWTDLLSHGRQWGLIVYEQDYMNEQFDDIAALHTDINLGKQWLKQMGNGAANNGLTIQYCMSLPRHMMQSLEIPMVTQARASGDYHPGKDNWKIGETSIFAWAIGVAPFKDNFWTTTVEPGNGYGGATEPNTALNAVVATLSTGPVGPSDMIGALNKTLIMRSVNADGLILKPSRPATSLDDKIRRMAWLDFLGPDGEVWSTVSDFGGYNKYGIMLAAGQNDSFGITPSNAGFIGFPTSMVFPCDNPNKIQLLLDSNPLVVRDCTLVNFCLYYASPILTIDGRQVLVQGELDKWVPMSPQRVTNIDVSEDITIGLTGAAYETVPFWFNVDGKSSSVTCALGPSGLATLSFNERACRGE